VRSRILSIDTTSEFGSLALVRDGELVEEAEVHSTEGFGHILFTEMESLLGQHGWRVSDIDCFAATAGPGSFTGVRVGLAAVKGLGEALGKPVAAVSNLQAVAWHGSRPFRAALLDARRGETYGAVYSADLALVSPEVVGGLAEWLETLQYENLELLSTDCGPLRVMLAGTHFAEAPITEVPRVLAGAVGRIASGRLAAGLTTEPAAVDANYVRRSDAEMFWRDL